MENDIEQEKGTFFHDRVWKYFCDCQSERPLYVIAALMLLIICPITAMAWYVGENTRLLSMMPLVLVACVALAVLVTLACKKIVPRTRKWRRLYHERACIH